MALSDNPKGYKTRLQTKDASRDLGAICPNSSHGGRDNKTLNQIMKLMSFLKSTSVV